MKNSFPPCSSPHQSVTAPIRNCVYTFLCLLELDAAEDLSLADLFDDMLVVREALEAMDALLLLLCERDLLLLLVRCLLFEALEVLRDLVADLFSDLPLELLRPLVGFPGLLFLPACFGWVFPFPDPLLRLLERSFRGVFVDCFFGMIAFGTSGKSALGWRLSLQEWMPQRKS